MTRLSPHGERIEAWNDPRQAAAEGAPPGFHWQGEPHRILEVCNHWRIHAQWWEGGQGVWREYFKVTTDSGLLCLIYHDLPSGGWFLSRVYD